MADPYKPISDWLSRVTIPDLYPRKDDPFRPGPGILPEGVPAGSMVSVEELGGINVFDGWVTPPGVRPVVYQRGVTYQLVVGTSPTPITPNQFQADTIEISNPSTAANSVFWGYGNGVTTTSGREIQAGIPFNIQADNVREPWELQKALEMIAAMIAAPYGYTPPGPYRAPRVVFNTNEWFLVAAAATTVSVTLYYMPELQ